MSGLPTWAYVVWGLSLVGGFTLGRFQERHKETMNMRNLANAYVRWYSRSAPVVVTAVAILALVGIWIGAAATVTNGNQDRRADAASRAVQRCFDRYAQAQSASSKAVREASVVKDEATAERDRALQTLTDSLITKAPSEHIRSILAELDAAGVALVAAQVQLDKARAENPVPDAPSEFCSVKP